MEVTASVDRRVLWAFGCDASSRPAPISVVEVQDVAVDPCDGFIIGCVPHDVNDVPFQETKKDSAAALSALVYCFPWSK